MARVTPILQTWKEPNALGENLILLRIQAANRRKYVSTKLAVKPKHWNKRLARVRATHSSADDYNALIERHVRKANNVIVRLKLDEMPLTVDAIKAGLTLKKSTRDFWAFADLWLDEKHRRNQIHYWRRARAVLRKFEKCASRPLPWSLLSLTTLRTFDTWMTERDNSGNTRGIAFKVLKTIFNDAIKQGIIAPDDNPFARFDMPKSEPVDRMKLTEDEFERLISVDLDANGWPGLARDLYIVAYFIQGTRFGDVLRLRAASVGDKRVNFRMGKNNVLVSSPLTPELNVVWERWGRPENADDYFFPPLRGRKFKDLEDEVAKVSSINARINKGLKDAAEAAGIDKKISFHTSRHTFAHRAYKKGVESRDIQRLLRHSKASTTDSYLRSLDDEGLDETLEQVYRRNEGNE